MIRPLSISTIRMKSLQANIERTGDYFTQEFRQPRTTDIFFRALVIYTFVKILFIWKVSATILQYHTMSFPRSVLGKVLLVPAILANAYLNAFYIGAVSFLVLAFFLRQNYIVRFLFFYLTFNLYVINLPLANGSDIVLFMLSLWCIPMGRFGPIKMNDKWHLQKVLYNLAVLLCQIQIVNTYLISGLDKLLSETWRSGDAFTYIRHLEFFYNPVLPQGLENSAWNFILSWCTILFELSFVVLILNRHTRIATIIVGVIFNLFIWIVLSIPDFALLMIISFVIFLKDEDFQVLKRFGKSSKW
jgi:hypothetical protein